MCLPAQHSFHFPLLAKQKAILEASEFTQRAFIGLSAHNHNSPFSECPFVPVVFVYAVILIVFVKLTHVKTSMGIVRYEFKSVAYIVFRFFVPPVLMNEDGIELFRG